MFANKNIMPPNDFGNNSHSRTNVTPALILKLSLQALFGSMSHRSCLGGEVLSKPLMKLIKTFYRLFYIRRYQVN